MSTSYSLRVGEQAAIRRRFFRKSWAVVYAGMPTERTFSLAITWSVNYNSAAYNVFLPLDQREMPFLDGRLVFESVSAQETRFRFE